MVEVVDAQVHTFDADNERYPWHRGAEFQPQKHSTTPVPYDQVLELMAEAGVSAAVLVIPGTYGNENGYLLEAARAHPEVFRVVGKIDPAAPDLDARVAEWASLPETLGLRVVIRTLASAARWERGDWAPLFAAAERHDVPVCINAPDHLADVSRIAETHPGLSILLDHLGLAGPPTTALAPDPFAELDDVLRLGRFPNVTIKATGVPALSRDAFPFRDVWAPLVRVVRAFGPERVMWGTDATRLVQPYKEIVDFVLEISDLSAEDKRLVLGANVRRILRWPQDG